jgi:hypothetical protein
VFFQLLNYKKPRFWVSLIGIIIVVVVAIGLLSNPKDEAGEVSIPIEKYVMEQSEEIAKPTVRLETDNKFVFNYSALSSYYATGSYQIDNDNSLILKTDDGKFQYVFKIKEKTLIFDSKESAEMPLYANIPDGSIFKLDNPSIVKNDPAKVEDYANQFIKEIIESYENPDGNSSGFKIVDSKITKLEKLETFDDILPNPIEVWSLEYRLKPDDISKVVIAGGMEEEDGWMEMEVFIMSFLTRI